MGTEVSIMNETLPEMSLKDRKMTTDGDRKGVYFRWNEEKHKGEKNNNKEIVNRLQETNPTTQCEKLLPWT